MKRRTAATAAMSLTALALVGGFAVAQAATATASSRPRAAAELVQPAYVDKQSAFYTSAQINDAWVAVVENFSQELPEGYSFSKSFPGFESLTAEDKKNALFEAALPDMAAAQYWRCAWLDSYITGAEGAQKSAAVTSALRSYSGLPSVATHDLTGYTNEVLSAFAEENGLADAEHALFALDCSGFSK